MTKKALPNWAEAIRRIGHLLLASDREKAGSRYKSRFRIKETFIKGLCSWVEVCLTYFASTASGCRLIRLDVNGSRPA